MSLLPRCIECSMQTRSSDEISVRPSVRLSNAKRMICDKTKESCALITWKTIYPSFMTRRMVGGGTTPSIWNFWSNWSRWSEITDFEPIFARSTYSEKVQLTPIGSPLRAFQWDKDDVRTLLLSPLKGAQKRKTAVFGVKSHYALRKSATEFLCVKTVSIVRHLLA